ncbi:hypothetical protein Tco_0291593 [Tanacetum coccineum]
MSSAHYHGLPDKTDNTIRISLGPGCTGGGAAAVASPARVLELDDSESDTEIPERHVSPTPHDAMLTRWRSRVASRSSSPTTSTLEIPIAPILPAPSCYVCTTSCCHLVLLLPHPRFVDDELFLSDPGRTFLLVNFTILILVGHVGPIDYEDVAEGLSLLEICLIIYMFPPTTFELSAKDSSSESSTGPSHKRCSDEEDIDTDVLEDIKADATTIEVVVDSDVEARIDACIGIEVDVGVDVKDEVEDEVESSDRGTMEVGVYMVARIDIPDGEEFDDGGERASLPEQVASLERSNARLQGTMMMERVRADMFLVTCVRFMKSDFRHIVGSDDDNGNGEMKWWRGKWGRWKPNENNRDAILFEKTETCFHISNCPEKYQVKYATCTLLNNALTWWNSDKRTIGTDVAFAMSWRELMKLMAEGHAVKKQKQKKFEVNQKETTMEQQLPCPKAKWCEIMRSPLWEMKVLIVQGDRGGKGENRQKETKDKSEEKRLEDVPTIQDFPEVFPEDLPGLAPTRQVEFQIDLVLSAAPVAPAHRIDYTVELQELVEMEDHSKNIQALRTELRHLSFNKEEHAEHLKLILELLKKEEFEGIHVDPTKIESIKDWAIAQDTDRNGSIARSRLDFYIIFYLRDLSFAHLAKVMAAPVLVAPEVGAVAVASPVGVLELDTHLSSDADPSESSLPLVSVAPMDMLTRWRSRVASRSSSPTTSIPEIPTAPILPAPSAIIVPLFEYPLAHVVAPPGIRRRRAILIQPGEDSPIGRLYRTYPGGPCRALTARKSVRPLPSHHLALRYTSHHLDRFTFGSSSSHSSSDHSSSGHSITGHSLFGHTPPDTTDADSYTPPRFVHPSLARTLQCSEAYLCWRSAPLSTMYPPTTSESSAGDSSSESSAGPSRKRCRSPSATVTSSIYATRALVLSRADLLPPRKRFRDSISLEDSVEEDIDTYAFADIEADTTVVEVVVDRDVAVEVDAGIGMEVDVGIDAKDEVEDEVESSDRGTMEVGVDVADGIDIPDAMLMPDAVERLEQAEEGLRDIYDHVIEILLQMIEDIKTG